MTYNRLIVSLPLMLAILSILSVSAQSLPLVYDRLQYTADSNLLVTLPDGSSQRLLRREARYSLSTVTPQLTAAADGLRMHFSNPRLRNGRITYGLIPYGQHSHPAAVLRFVATIDAEGYALLNIRNDLREGYDHTGWQQLGYGVIGYRLTDSQGSIVYEGKQAFELAEGMFSPLPTLLRGPFISLQTATSVVIWYETSVPTPGLLTLAADGRTFGSSQPATRHEIAVTGLLPNRRYDYQLSCGRTHVAYHFHTAPAAGEQTPFTFAYASDSRSGYGGGERSLGGTNSQIMSRIAALSLREGAAFVQFTGDLVDGYVSQPDEMRLQLVNWIHAVEPYWHYIPFNVGMGNHESLGWANGEGRVAVDGFPWHSHSGEALFAERFVNPLNGPESEDGAVYDPQPAQPGDFPSYKENVYYYTYGNTAMVVLNSNYWFAPGLRRAPFIGGNLHGYLMDNQLQWLSAIIRQLEEDAAIDHVFVTLHTPPFPNGGHRGDCMWYDGNNEPRPHVAGKPVEKGIIERRDQFLDILANQSTKVVAVMAGDEHNYNRMRIDDATPRYPDNWDKPQQPLRQPFWQIINGAAGAPFYAQQQTPWSAAVEGFTVQNALCLFDISGKKVLLRVINPDTLEEIDRAQLR